MSENGTDITTTRRSFPGRRRAKHPTKAVREAVCEGILRGMHNKTASRLAGIHEATFYTWRTKGENEIEVAQKQHPEGVPDGHPWSDWALFALEIAEADANLESNLLDRIMQAGFAEGKNWTALMTILERRFPELWSKFQTVEHSGKIEGGDAEQFAEAFFGRIRSIAARGAISEDAGPGDGGGLPGDPPQLEILGEAKPGRT